MLLILAERLLMHMIRSLKQKTIKAMGPFYILTAFLVNNLVSSKPCLIIVYRSRASTSAILIVWFGDLTGNGIKEF